MKYCSKCGTELLDDAVFCFGCGCRAPHKYTEFKHVKQINSSQAQQQSVQPKQVNIERVRPRYLYDAETKSYTRDGDTYQSEDVANDSSDNVDFDMQDNSNYIFGQYSVNYKRRSALGLISIIFAICGILFNCALALLGHICGIIAIIVGICAIAKAPKDAKSYLGFGFGIVCELLAIINSLIGAQSGASIG